ncbi:MAG: hypothetical protein QOJ99_3707 [Bryobacterales bacterium]|jgi:uncharacterized protein YjbI with pentapeptide repeats|nr:hypothetical protein [Bryobacterales bacterium]
MNDDLQYGQFAAACEEEMAAMQARIAEVWLFEPSMESGSGVIAFRDGDLVALEADVVLVGSWGRKFGSWRWAWANPELPEGVRAESRSLRELSNHTGRPEFTYENAFAVTEKQCRTLVAVAGCHLNGIGIYVAPGDPSDWFFVIRKLTKNIDEPGLAAKAEAAVAEIVGRGSTPTVLNALRKRFPGIRLEFTGADLRGEPEEWAYDLHVQPLVDRDRLSTHRARDLSGADLSGARFDEAILRGLILRGASFMNSSLVNADFSGADLREASLQGAFLNGANLTRARLAGADFSGAELARTLLTDVDLSAVKGLDEVHHAAASEISLSTLIASRFELRPTFLRKAGVSRGLIEDLLRGKEFSKAFQTCFLSYSSRDSEFSGKLYESLSAMGVRVFWDHFDVIPGEYLEDQIQREFAGTTGCWSCCRRTAWRASG